MERRLLFVAACAVASIVSVSRAAETKRPNIIVIVADDMELCVSAAPINYRKTTGILVCFCCFNETRMQFDFRAIRGDWRELTTFCYRSHPSVEGERGKSESLRASLCWAKLPCAFSAISRP